MKPDGGITPQAEVRGSVVCGDAHHHEGERQEAPIPPLDQSPLKARVEEILNRRPAVGLAVGVVRDGSLESYYGHGFADIASGTPVTEDTVFRISSISKTFSAIAIMQLWERGLVDLDAPANDYLQAYRLVSTKASWRPATVRHLLTHTAGVPQWAHPSHVGTARVVFNCDAAGVATGVHLDGILLSAEKRPASRNPRRWATGAIGAIAAATAVTVVRRARSKSYKRM